jgi:hypothetical protein
VSFVPRKAHVIISLKLPQSKDVEDQLEEAGLETWNYETLWKQYSVRISGAVDDKQRQLLLRLIGQASEGFRKRS